MGNQWQQLAGIAAEHGEATLARQAIDLFLEAAGGQVAAGYQKVGLLSRIGAFEDAYDMLCSLPDSVPDQVVNAYSRGALAGYIGRQDEARERLTEVVRQRPGLAQAWLPLAALVNFACELEWMDAIQAAGRQIEAAPPPQRALFYYALGKAYADRGEHALAISAFEHGAGLKKPQLDYSRARDKASAEDALRGYSRERIAAIAEGQSEDTARTLFVTGLPRSGTTLVEQILTSHSGVAGGGEINLLRLLAQEVGGASFPSIGEHVVDKGTAHAAQLWHHWMDERFGKQGRVVDKSLDTSRYLGLASALLPEAPIIWIRRDPLDCAWSCFRTNFHAGVDWSHDLEDIAFHFRLEDELVERWQDILGERLLVVPFEELVTEPEDWICRMLRHCDLEVEPQVFKPHENARTVATSSAIQVREPINRKGLGAAEPYREFLAPFLAAYSD